MPTTRYSKPIPLLSKRHLLSTTTMRQVVRSTSERDIVAEENRRLQSEVAQLTGRVNAFEASRWWRLHPRFALRRLRPLFVATHSTKQPDASRAGVWSTSATELLIARFRTEVMARGNFGYDTTRSFPPMERVLKELEGRSSRILEIGSLQGLSACLFLWRLPDAQVTCIDTFAGGYEEVVFGVDASGLEPVFDRNIAAVDASRARKLVGDSRRVLLDLVGAQEEFDFVYIDGSHLALDVLVDASLSWQLLAPGGTAVFDDYRWAMLGTDPLFRPGPAIDAFLRLLAGQCEAGAGDRAEGTHELEP